MSSLLAAREGNTPRQSAFIFLHQPSAPGMARKGVTSAPVTTALPRAPPGDRAVCRAGLSRAMKPQQRRRKQPLRGPLQPAVTEGELRSKGGGHHWRLLWVFQGSVKGGVKSWPLGCLALRGPLARGKALDPEPCTGTAVAAAAEHFWCLGTCVPCPSPSGDKREVWHGRTSTSNTFRRGQERRGVLPSPDPPSLGAGDNPKARTRAPHATLRTGTVWSAWCPSCSPQGYAPPQH